MKKELMLKIIKKWEKELEDKRQEEILQEYYDTLEAVVAKPFRYPIDWVLAITATIIIIGIIFCP